MKKIKEIELKNDVWFLSVVGDKIIINNNYTGISIYNSEIELIKKVFIIYDLTIYPYLLYVNNNEILLYCYENMKLAYVNLNNFECKIINLPKDMEEITFSKVYNWYEDKIILSSYENQFFEVNLKKCIIKKISADIIKNFYHDFYTFYKVYKSCMCENHSVEIFKNNRILLIYRKNKRNNLNIIKYDKSRYVSNKMHINIDIDFYNIIYEKDIVAAIDENVIEIITKKNKEKLILENRYMYCGASFLQKNNKMFLIVLVSDNSNVEYSKLILYEI